MCLVCLRLYDWKEWLGVVFCSLCVTASMHSIIVDIMLLIYCRWQKQASLLIQRTCQVISLIRKTNSTQCTVTFFYAVYWRRLSFLQRAMSSCWFSTPQVEFYQTVAMGKFIPWLISTVRETCDSFTAVQVLLSTISSR